MRHVFAALALATIASHAMAEDGYTAKSLFFGEDDSLRTVATSPAPAVTERTAVAAQTASSAAVTVSDNKADSAKKPRVLRVSHKKVENVGASYFIRLKEADGSTRDVLARRVFKSGEHFQLGVKVNHPSYVYILNEAPDGSLTQIYPQPSQDNFVDAMGVVFLPARGSFVFDNKPGMEKLMVYLSSEPLKTDVRKRVTGYTPDFVSSPINTAAACTPRVSVTTADAPLPGSGPDVALQVASADTGAGYATKGIEFAADEKSSCSTTVAAAEPEYASKGIVFSEDSAPTSGGQVASYVVKPTTASDANLYLKINLAHE